MIDEVHFARLLREPRGDTAVHRLRQVCVRSDELRLRTMNMEWQPECELLLQMLLLLHLLHVLHVQVLLLLNLFLVCAKLLILLQLMVLL